RQRYQSTWSVVAWLSLKRMVNLTTRCPQRGRNNSAILTAASFRVVCLLLTTSGEVVPVIPQQQEICII
ncbi:hypothetical protein EP093_21930, partial [Shigella flexneri]|nr:hypothetical protein [Shigella flexneri]